MDRQRILNRFRHPVDIEKKMQTGDMCLYEIFIYCAKIIDNRIFVPAAWMIIIPERIRMIRKNTRVECLSYYSS